MIVRARGQVLELYDQIEHARIAAVMAEQFGGAGFVTAAPLERSAHVVSIHDCGWAGPDKAPVVDSDKGRPRSFMETPGDESAAIWSGSIKGVAQTAGPFGGMVVSAHFSRMASMALDSTNRTDEERAAFKRFLDNQAQWQAEWRAALEGQSDSPTGASIEAAIALLQACDMFSIYTLIGSGNKIIQGDPCALGAGGQDVTFQFTWPEPRTMTIAPWPFRQSELTIETQCRVIPQKEYASDQELQKALEDSREEKFTYRVVKSS